MSICEVIAAPAFEPNPGTTLSTPSGIPAFKINHIKLNFNNIKIENLINEFEFNHTCLAR